MTSFGKNVKQNIHEQWDSVKLFLRKRRQGVQFFLRQQQTMTTFTYMVRETNFGNVTCQCRIRKQIFDKNILKKTFNVPDV
mgnify:CR=1 FL=1